MQFLLLVYASEAELAAQDPAAQSLMYRDYGAFVRAVAESGQLKTGDALEPVAAAKTIRVRGGDLSIADGPFAETHEQLGGYFLVEAADLDEAVRIAARIPTATLGSIEIRPIKRYS